MNIRKQLIAIAALLLIGGVVYAASETLYRVTNISGVGFKIPPSQITKIDEFTSPDCRRVRNMSATNSLFVPADSTDSGDGLTQWRAFYNNVSPSIAAVTACPSTPSCVIEVNSGGIGGAPDGSVLNLGWAFTATNSSGSLSNCSFSATTNYGTGSHYESRSYGPFVATPGGPAAWGAPSFGVNAMAWSGQNFTTFDVDGTAVSVSCPLLTSPTPASGPGWTSHANFNSSNFSSGTSNKITINCI